MAVNVARHDGYVHLELAEPERRNPLSHATLRELRDAVTAHVDDGVNTVVVSGAGTTFSAGADLTELTGTAADVAIDDAIAATLDTVRGAGTLTVAAVDGPCMGGACDLVLACDLVIAGADAVFAVPAVRLGIMYNPDAVARWHRRLPRQTLVRLLFGDRFDASEAYAGGLVGKLVDAGGAMAAAVDLAERLADAPPAVVAAMKDLLGDLDNGADLSRAHEVRHQLLASPERGGLLRSVRRKGNG